MVVDSVVLAPGIAHLARMSEGILKEDVQKSPIIPEVSGPEKIVL